MHLCALIAKRRMGGKPSKDEQALNDSSAFVVPPKTKSVSEKPSKKNVDEVFEALRILILLN